MTGLLWIVMIDKEGVAMMYMYQMFLVQEVSEVSCEHRGGIVAPHPLTLEIDQSYYRRVRIISPPYTALTHT